MNIDFDDGREIWQNLGIAGRCLAAKLACMSFRVPPDVFEAACDAASETLYLTTSGLGSILGSLLTFRAVSR